VHRPEGREGAHGCAPPAPEGGPGSPKQDVEGWRVRVFFRAKNEKNIVAFIKGLFII